MQFAISLFSTPAILLGLVAFVGLVAQKKSATDTMTGTFKTIIGFLVFGFGGSAITGALQNSICYFSMVLILKESLLLLKQQQL